MASGKIFHPSNLLLFVVATACSANRRQCWKTIKEPESKTSDVLPEIVQSDIKKVNRLDGLMVENILFYK